QIDCGVALEEDILVGHGEDKILVIAEVGKTSPLHEIRPQVSGRFTGQKMYNLALGLRRGVIADVKDWIVVMPSKRRVSSVTHAGDVDNAGLLGLGRNVDAFGHRPLAFV